jgi:hypothetical protein
VRVLGKAVVRQLVWSRDLPKNTVDKDPKYALGTFSCMKCETERQLSTVSKHNFDLVKTIKIIIDQSHYGIYVQIIMTSSTNKYLLPYISLWEFML